MAALVAFGEFVLDLESRELRRGDERLKLSPKALLLLEILATGRPRAFSKAELQDRLWPDTFVVEKNLANLVKEIRETLGDNPSDQRFIRTVPRYGYAFRDNAGILASSPAPGTTRSAFVLAAGLFCLVAAVVSLSWFAGRPSRTDATTTPGGHERTRRSAAHEQYLRGRYHFQKDTRDGLERARGHFQDAVALDPTYAQAYGGLAEVYLALGEYAVMSIADAHALAREAATAALKLDDSLADAHRSLAVISGQRRWEWAAAERSFQRAMQLAPNDVTTLRMYSFHLAYTGRPVRALPIARLAASLDPVSVPAQLNLGVVLYLSGHADEAVQQLSDVLDLDANAGFAHVMLALVYASQRLPERAVDESARALALAARRPDIVAVHGFCLGRAGHRIEALATLDDIARLTKPGMPPPFQMALIHIGLEDWERAFEWLEKAIDGRAWEVPLLKADPAFARLRLQPRFPALLARVGLPE